jgi:hypothetical protein
MRPAEGGVGGRDAGARPCRDSGPAVVADVRRTPAPALQTPVNDRALEGLKFNECLTDTLAGKELTQRLTDTVAIAQVMERQVKLVSRVLGGIANDS